MKCSESERRIHCYRELDDRERIETDQHLETCPSCRETMETVNPAGSVIKAWQRITPTLPNEAQMTSRIMDVIRKEQERKTLAWIPYLQNLGMSALRYTMAAVSLLLIGLFLGEYAKDSEGLQGAKHYRATTEETTELNLAAFRSGFFAAKRKEQQTSTSMFQCVRACLRNDGHDCADCLEKYSKP